MALLLLIAVLSLFPGLLLAVAALPLPMPAAFGVLLRWSVICAGLLLAAHALRLRNVRMAIAFALIAVVYNPFLGAGEGSVIWRLIDLFAAVPFLIYPFVLPRPRRTHRRSHRSSVPAAEEQPALAPPEGSGHSAGAAEVAASAREMYGRYGPKALALARNRQRQLVATGRTHMAEEWRKLVAALEPLVAGAASEAEAVPQGDDGAGSPVDLEFEEIHPPGQGRFGDGG